MRQQAGPRIAIALDFETQERALQLARQLDPQQCRLKVGKELFTRCGPALVEQLQGMGFDIFLDLKFHDIPNTVAKAVSVAADLGVWMVNVHASGGTRMMSAASEALAKYKQPPLLIGVTVLTSMTDEDLREVGVAGSAAEQVNHLARLTQQSGLDGVVCSAQEAAQLRESLGPDFVLVTPGIRPAGTEPGDQRRTVTPEQALANGSDYLVVGRPVTQADDPAQACRVLCESCVR